MKVLNSSKNKVLAQKIIIADSFLKKTKGLLGFESPASMFFKTRWGIHTIGMKFSIDCIVCDGNFEVKRVREKMDPGNLFFWPPAYKNVLELPSGTIERTGTRIGDKVKLID